jgi:WD40 repeat protein/serine/threonine protein kinase
MAQETIWKDKSAPLAVPETVFVDRCAETLAAAEAAVAEDWNIGDVVLDLYEVRDVLGEGGFGKVYRVHHRGWNVDLAVKTPRQDRLAYLGKETFKREAETWVDLGAHPHIVSCFYVRDLGGIPRVFSECVEGGSLSQWIQSRKLYEGDNTETVRRILDVAIQFAWGLNYAHEVGLVHQDVKPGNVMMTPDAVAKVTDFGLATSRLTTNEKSTFTPALTPAYASPEQHLNGPVSARTDIWSWGLSLLEMFAGQTFWRDGRAAPDILDEYLSNRELSHSQPPIPAQVVDILRRCFRLDVDSRPVNMTEIVAELSKSYRSEVGHPYQRSVPNAAKGSADSLNNRALSFLDLGKTNRAIEIWKNVLAEYPTHPEAVCNLNLVQWRSGEIALPQLIERVKSVFNASSEQTNNHWLKLVEVESGDLDGTIAQLQGVLSLNPHLVEVRSALEMVGTGRIASNAPVDPELESHHSGAAAPFLRYWQRIAEYLSDAQHSIKKVTQTSAHHRRRFVLFANETKKTHLIRDTEEPSFKRRLRKTLLDTLIAGWTGQLYSYSPWGELVRGLRAFKNWFLKHGQYGRILSFLSIAIIWLIGLIILLAVFGLIAGAAIFILLLIPRVLYFQIKDQLRRDYIALKSHFGQSVIASISADGSRVASWCSNREINFESLRYWNLTDGKTRSVFEDREGENTNHYITAPREDRKPINLVERVFPATTMWTYLYHDEELVSISEWQRGFEVSAISISSDERSLIAGCSDGIVRNYDVTSESLNYMFSGSGGRVGSVCVSEDGLLAVSGAEDAVVRIWDLGTGTCVGILRGHKTAVKSVAIDGPKAQIISGAADGEVRVWEVKTGRCLRSYNRHNSPIIAVDISAESNLAASLSENGQLFFWKCPVTGVDIAPFQLARVQESGTLIEAEMNFQNLLSRAEAAIEDGKHEQALGLLAEAKQIEGYEQAEIILDLTEKLYPHVKRVGIKSMWRAKLLSRNGGAPTGVRFSGNGETLMSSHLPDPENREGTLRTWDINEGTCRRNFQFGTHVTGMALTHNGRTGASATVNGELMLWDLDRGQLIKRFDTSDDPSKHCRAYCVAMTESGRSVISAGFAVYHWSVKTGSVLHRNPWKIRFNSQFVQSIDVDPEGRVAVAGEHGGSIRIWHMEPNRVVKLAAHTGVVMAARISRDANFALTGGSDGDIRFWNLSDDSCKTVLQAQTAITAIDIEGSSRYAVSGDSSGVVKIWDLHLGKCLYSVKCHEREVTGVAINPSFRYICSAGADGVLQLWEIDWELETR